MSASKITTTEKDFRDFISGDKDPMLDLIKDDFGASETEITLPKHTRLKNTYHTEPRRPFPYSKGNKIINRILSSLEEVEYCPEKCAKLAVDLCDQIRKQVKLVSSPRYKLAIIVHLGQKDDQGLFMGSRCLWNVDFDSFSSATYVNSTLFAIGIVFACYFE